MTYEKMLRSASRAAMARLPLGRYQQLVDDPPRGAAAALGSCCAAGGPVQGTRTRLLLLTVHVFRGNETGF